MATGTVFSGFSFTYLSFFLSSFLIVGILFFVYLLVRRYTVKPSKRTVEIVEKISLDRHNMIYLLKFPDNRYLYISSGPGGVTILDEVDELEVAEKIPKANRKFKEIFFKRIGKFSLSDELDKLEKMEK